MENTRYFTVPGSARKYDRNWMLAVLLISLMMSLLQVSSVNNLLPSIESSMHAGETDIQLVLSGYALALGITLVPAGRLGDIFGRSSLWVIGISVFTVASLLVGSSDSIVHLNLMRVLQGIGAGFYSPQVTGLIQQYFQGRARARAFGLMGLVVSMSVAVGPLISGTLVGIFGEDPGWRFSVFLNVPLGIIGVIAAWRFLPFGKERRTIGANADEVEAEYEARELAEGRTPARKRGPAIDLDPLGMLLLALSVLAIMLTFMLHGVSWRWFLFVGGLALLGVWVSWEHWYASRGHFPMVNMEMFKIRSFSYCTAISGIQFLGSSTIFVILALFAQDGLGKSALAVGMIGFPNAVLSGFAAVWSGKRAMDKGKQVQVLGLSLAVGSIVLLVATVYAVTHMGWALWTIAIPLLPLGFGFGCIGAANQTQAMMDVPTAHGGTAGGLQQTTQRITTAIGNALITGVLFSTYRGGATVDDWFTGFSIAMGVITIIVSAALALAIVFMVRKPSR